MRKGKVILLCYELVILATAGYIAIDYIQHDIRMKAKVIGKMDTLNKGRPATYMEMQYSFGGYKYSGQANYPFRSEEKRPLIEDEVEIRVKSKNPSSFFLVRYNLYLNGLIALSALAAAGFIFAYVIKRLPIRDNQPGQNQLG